MESGISGISAWRRHMVPGRRRRPHPVPKAHRKAKPSFRRVFPTPAELHCGMREYGSVLEFQGSLKTTNANQKAGHHPHDVLPLSRRTSA
jgi:hypothetical protein